jgi:hypothetical protein
MNFSPKWVLLLRIYGNYDFPPAPGKLQYAPQMMVCSAVKHLLLLSDSRLQSWLPGTMYGQSLCDSRLIWLTRKLDKNSNSNPMAAHLFTSRWVNVQARLSITIVRATGLCLCGSRIPTSRMKSAPTTPNVMTQPTNWLDTTHRLVSTQKRH